DRKISMLQRLVQELNSISIRIDGVMSVETKIGKDFPITGVYRKTDLELSPPILLVDDEAEFIDTLSERLAMRRMKSRTVYNGAAALSSIAENEPAVMVLDLKMPEIDGIGVLRKIKESGSKIKVIVLTGHGAKSDKKTCMELGAFAYMNKPVNFEILIETLNSALGR
ncbi:MAG: response regulator, partial [Pseudomonadota bacterium]